MTLSGTLCGPWTAPAPSASSRARRRRSLRHLGFSRARWLQGSLPHLSTYRGSEGWQPQALEGGHARGQTARPLGAGGPQLQSR